MYDCDLDFCDISLSHFFVHQNLLGNLLDSIIPFFSPISFRIKRQISYIDDVMTIDMSSTKKRIVFNPLQRSASSQSKTLCDYLFFESISGAMSLEFVTTYKITKIEKKNINRCH